MMLKFVLLKTNPKLSNQHSFINYYWITVSIKLIPSLQGKLSTAISSLLALQQATYRVFHDFSA